MVVREVEERVRAEGGGVEVDYLSLGGLSLMERLIGWKKAILVDSLTAGKYPQGEVITFTLEDLVDLTSSHTAAAHDTSLSPRVVQSMRDAAAEAGVFIAAGDTKVVQKGGADKLFVNTSGLGRVKAGLKISGANAKAGDVIIVSGTLGDHGMTVLSVREGLGFETGLQSDVAPLNHLVAEMLEAGETHVLRDPTCGGLATTLNEIAQQSNVSIELREQVLPVRPQVRAACEMLGFDPLYVANEGKLVAFVAKKDAGKVLEAMRKNKYGENTCVIGRVGEGSPQVRLKTAIGGTRLVDMLPGEMLPRIC